jgi:3-phenylpropionate/trans-cinnamate dioxygenase ferredoxin reductase component
VIVGGGLGAARTAEQLRRAEYAGPITIVSDEDHLPYDRPPLSKEVLRAETDDVTLKPAEFYDENDITVLLGKAVRSVNTDAKTVTLADGSELGYDELIIATGLVPKRIPSFPELPGIHVLRSFDESLKLRKEAGSAGRAVVVGAGFIGCEVASSARKLGLEVSLFDIASTPMPALGPLLGERCAALHRAHGVDLCLGVSIAALYGENGRVHGLELSDGARHEADVVVVALGAVPCTDWLADSGLAVERGVRCDATLTVEGDPDLLAAGDIVEWPHPLAADRPIRVEHWTNAAEQGAHAGRNSVLAAPHRAPYAGIPSFWSDQYGIRIQALGLPHLADRHHVVEETDDGSRLVAVAERAGVLVGVVAFDGARRLPKYRHRLGSPLDLESLSAELADDPQALGATARAA